jgi:hypothetical protein
MVAIEFVTATNPMITAARANFMPAAVRTPSLAFIGIGSKYTNSFEFGILRIFQDVNINFMILNSRGASQFMSRAPSSETAAFAAISLTPGFSGVWVANLTS